MGNTKRIVLIAALAGLSTPIATRAADETYYRQVAQEACMGDVLTLCSAYVPDETSIMACMAQRRRDLSAPCRKAFDVGMRAHHARSGG